MKTLNHILSVILIASMIFVVSCSKAEDPTLPSPEEPIAKGQLIQLGFDGNTCDDSDCQGKGVQIEGIPYVLEGSLPEHVTDLPEWYNRDYIGTVRFLAEPCRQCYNALISPLPGQPPVVDYREIGRVEILEIREQ